MKLISWNTQWCCGLDGVASPRRIVEAARTLADFDLLCLQEIAQGYPGLAGAPGDQPAELAALLPDFALFFGAAVDEFTPDGRHQRFGNLVATRLPVLHAEQHRLPWPADAAVPSMPRQCTAVTLQHPRLGAVRVMTTHLEYYSQPQRQAQTEALRALYLEGRARAEAPPVPGEAGGPFQPKAQPLHALLCGDFNFDPQAPEYALLQAPQPLPHRPKDWPDHLPNGHPARLHDAWPLVHGTTPHAPTFRLFERQHGPGPLACDFVFVSDSLVPHVRHVAVDDRTQASDHQPVLIELG